MSTKEEKVDPTEKDNETVSKSEYDVLKAKYDKMTESVNNGKIEAKTKGYNKAISDLKDDDTELTNFLSNIDIDKLDAMGFTTKENRDDLEAKIERAKEAKYKEKLENELGSAEDFYRKNTESVLKAELKSKGAKDSILNLILPGLVSSMKKKGESRFDLAYTTAEGKVLDIPEYAEYISEQDDYKDLFTDKSAKQNVTREQFVNTDLTRSNNGSAGSIQEVDYDDYLKLTPTDQQKLIQRIDKGEAKITVSTEE